MQFSTSESLHRYQPWSGEPWETRQASRRKTEAFNIGTLEHERQNIKHTK